MSSDEMSHIDSINDTLKILLTEIKIMNKTMQDISNKLNKIANDTYRIP